MNKGISLRDVSFSISAGLIVVAGFLAITGLVSDLWDLNEFVLHKYAGYVVVILGFTHVALHWGRLTSYFRWRIRGASRARRSTKHISDQGGIKGHGLILPSEKTIKPGDMVNEGRGPRVSRRDFIPLTIGGVGGLALASIFRKETALPYEEDVGSLYHEWSKPKLLSLLGTLASWGESPPLYKEYPEAERIELPPVTEVKGLSATETIKRRRSVRSYNNQDIILGELSNLLYYTGGLSGEQWGRKLRAAPSAGALYPIELYLVIHRVEGLEPGLYHYAVKDHAMELLRADDLKGEIVIRGLGQEFLGQANLVLVFTAIFQRLRWKYRERSYRYALLEAGHLGQNVYLAGASMGLGVCAVGAFLDDELNSMLGVDGQEEAAVYTLAVGRMKGEG